MLELYYLPGACSTVPHVALEWSGLAYTAKAVGRDELKSPKYLALNPLGAVPLLVDGDWTLTENLAIIDYIDDLSPESNIFSVEGNLDIRVRARARQWLAFANSDLHPAYSLLFNSSRIIDGEKAQVDLQAHAAKRILSLYAVVDEALKHQHFLVGKNISIADVYIFVTMGWAQALELDLSHFTHLNTHYKRVADNPTVQYVLREQGQV